MNGIEKITGRIQEDAQREIDQVLAQAQAEADAIAARYAAQAEKESADLVARGRRSADERMERLVSVAQLEAKKLTLAAKQEMLGRAFDLALEKLCQLPEDEYVKLLAGLAVRASRTGREEIILSQADRARYGVKVATLANQMLEKANPKRSGGAGLTLSEQTRSIKGGLLLADGEVEVNCTFETLVRLTRGEIAGEVAKALFA